MKLYQAEWCPFSHRVRAKLTELGIDYELVNVPASSNKRGDLEKVAGTKPYPCSWTGRTSYRIRTRRYSIWRRSTERNPMN